MISIIYNFYFLLSCILLTFNTGRSPLRNKKRFQKSDPHKNLVLKVKISVFMYNKCGYFFNNKKESK